MTICESCGETICTVPGCETSERALVVILAKLPPAREPTAEDIAHMQARARFKK